MPAPALSPFASVTRSAIVGRMRSVCFTLTSITTSPPSSDGSTLTVLNRRSSSSRRVSIATFARRNGAPALDARCRVTAAGGRSLSPIDPDLADDQAVEGIGRRADGDRRQEGNV